MNGRKQRIAILGGGIAGLSAAYQLMRTPLLREQHEVTVYQLGFRLGGKLASGRNPERYGRNEEHGLHVWLGFYENAFSMIADVYDALPFEPDAPFRSWHDVFKKQSFTPVGAAWDGGFSFAKIEWPENADVPGDGRLLLTPWGAISELIDLLKDLFGAFRTRVEIDVDPLDILPNFIADRINESLSMFGQLAATTILGLFEHALEVARAALDAVPTSSGAQRGLSALLELIEQKISERLEHMPQYPELRAIWHALVIGLAIVRGLLDPEWDIVRDFDLDRVDHYELREFLKRYTAFPAIIDNADELRAFYDLGFFYEAGRIDRPNISAAAGLRAILRIVLTYKGAILYLPQAGFGEAVIAPLYRVLLQNGVEFRFFHRVTGLEPASDRRLVEKIVLEEQARTVDGKPYQPLARHKGLWCWPLEPFWEQLENGARLKEERIDFESKWRQPKSEDVRKVELVRGSDFDSVVLALPHGALKRFGAEATPLDELYRESPGLKTAIDGLGVVPTLSSQLWMKPDLTGLGWHDPPPAFVAAPEVLDVWADMSQTLAFEGWPAGGPESVHYWCGPFDGMALVERPAADRAVPERALEAGLSLVDEWFGANTGWLWPGATEPSNPHALDYEKLWAPAALSGRARLAWQALRVHVDPAECVATSLAGGAKHRLCTDESGYDNLFLAGDWIHTVIDTVCVEGAVSAGMAAARAICGAPERIVGEGFFCARPLTSRAYPRALSGTPRASSAPPPSDHRSAAHDPAELPEYVSFYGSGEQSIEPPGKVVGARCYYFSVAADAGKLQAFVDAKLNAPARGAVRYHVLGSQVLLSFLAADKLFSPAEIVGYLPDRECALWVPLVAAQPGAPDALRLVAWMPYIVIDSSSGMCTGREVWGFRKEIGECTIPSDPRYAETWLAKATLFRSFSTQTLGELLPLLTVRRNSSLERAEPHALLEGLSDGARALAAVIEGLTAGSGQLSVHAWPGELMVDVAKLFFERNVPLVNLKQFRDARDPRRACYQALIESPIHLDRLRGFGVLSGAYTLEIAACDSHRIARDLGLGETSSVAVDFAFYVDMDFSADVGKVVWQAR